MLQSLGLIYTSEVLISRFKGNYKNEYDKINYRDILERKEQINNIQVSTSQAIEEPVEIFTVKQLFKRYAVEKLNSKSWLPKMERSVCNIMNILLEHFGDIDIRSIKHQHLLDFRDNVMLKLPANWKILPDFKDLSLAEVLEKYDGPSQKPINIY